MDKVPSYSERTDATHLRLVAVRQAVTDQGRYRALDVRGEPRQAAGKSQLGAALNWAYVR